MNDWAAYLPEPAIPGTTGNARRQSRTRRQRPDSLVSMVSTPRPLRGVPTAPSPGCRSSGAGQAMEAPRPFDC